MKQLLGLFLAFFFLLNQVSPVLAREGSVLGIHILNPDELPMADNLFSADQNQENWHYVTIPLTLQDLEREDQWQRFFDECKKHKIIPLVRLTTRFENGAWQVPNRKEVTDQITFLSKLNWPTDKKHIIIYNEVNHAKEWGGTLNPVSYAEVLSFASRWARFEDKNYVVMPAAMDLAAPNGSVTMEAFNFLSQMLNTDPEVFAYIDAWNSHSYPNPGFSSSPQRTGKNSLRGFEHEMAFMKEKVGKDDYPIYITETGWVANGSTTPWLESYYLYALQHIWSDPRVVAVTPFVLRGDPGPFAGFGFIDRNNNPTYHYQALQNAVKKSSEG